MLPSFIPNRSASSYLLLLLDPRKLSPSQQFSVLLKSHLLTPINPHPCNITQLISRTIHLQKLSMTASQYSITMSFAPSSPLLTMGQISLNSIQGSVQHIIDPPPPSATPTPVQPNVNPAHHSETMITIPMTPPNPSVAFHHHPERPSTPPPSVTRLEIEQFPWKCLPATRIFRRSFSDLSLRAIIVAVSIAVRVRSGNAGEVCTPDPKDFTLRAKPWLLDRR